MTDVASAVPMTRQLADFAASVEAGSLPGPVVHNARRALVDWLAAALAGAREPAAERWRMQRQHSTIEVPPHSALLGRRCARASGRRVNKSPIFGSQHWRSSP